jgi:hypothetical protein
VGGTLGKSPKNNHMNEKIKQKCEKYKLDGATCGFMTAKPGTDGP